jgi:hypothetical protein
VKKIIYIFIIGSGLLAASCQKQEIVPVSDGMEIPTWEDDSNARTGQGESTGETGEEPGDEGGNGNGVDITDPNKPSEGSGKGKGNS